MGQIVGTSAKVKRCNLTAIRSGGSLYSTVLADGEYMLVSSDNSMTATGNGNFDSYIVGDGTKTCGALTLQDITTIDNDIIKGSKNPIGSGALYDKFTIQQFENYAIGGYIDTNGRPALDSSYAFCTYIPANTGDTVEWKYGSTNVNSINMGMYNSSKVFQNYYTANDVSGTRTVTIQTANIAYIRCSFILADIADCYVKVNGVLMWSAESPRNGVYGWLADKLPTQYSNNLVSSGGIYSTINGQEKNYVEGGYFSITGSIITSSSYCYETDYIPINRYDIVEWKFSDSNEEIYACAYDSGYNFATYYSGNVESVVNGKRTFSISKSTYNYIRFSFASDSIDDCYVKVNGVVVWTPRHTIVGVNQSIDEINTAIYSPFIYSHYTEGARILQNDVLSANANWGYTEFIPVQVSDVVKVIFGTTGESGVAAIAIYNESKQYLNFYSTNGYNLERDNMTISTEGAAYIRANVYLPNLNNCAVYVNGELVWKAGAVTGLVPRVASLETQINNIEKALPSGEGKKLYLPLLALINIATSYGHLVSNEEYDNKRVTTKCALCLPKIGVTWTVKLPNNYYALIPTSTSATDNNFTLSDWLSNGDTLNPSSRLVYRVSFKKGENEVLPVSEIKSLIESGDIAIYTTDKDPSVVERNSYKGCLVGALRRILITPLENSGMDSMPVFAHISDVHGDVMRLKNCLEYCDYISPLALLVSGDSVTYKGPNDLTDYQEDLAKDYSTDFLYCIGNHESWPTGDTDLYNKHMAALATRYSYLISSGTTTDKCYWYKDYATKNTRVIAINYYEGGVYNGCLGQAQITWFINTLLSTPAGYGIIVMLHSPEDKVTASSPYDVFFQKHRVTTYQEDGFYVGNRPIMQIIDAFISRTTISTSYTESTSESVTITADFSSVDVSTEFIAYICGHRHEDWIGYYYHSTNMQLCLCVTTGNGLYGDASYRAWSNQSDLPRGDKDVCQDAFNMYAIDRTNKRIKVVRVGADVTEDFVDRKLMVIPYKAQENA